MADQAVAMKGKIRGVGQVIDKATGKVKSTFEFVGETPQTEEELRDLLNLPPDETAKIEEKD